MQLNPAKVSVKIRVRPQFSLFHLLNTPVQMRNCCVYVRTNINIIK